MAKLTLTPQLGQQIVDLIKRGNHAKVAAQACGITEATFYNWLKKGEKAHKGILRDFYEAIQRANAVPEVTVVGALFNKAVEGDVRAMDIFLARRYRERWGAQQTVNVGNAEGQPFQTTQLTLSEWTAEQDKRAQQAKETMQLFNEQAEDDADETLSIFS